MPGQEMRYYEDLEAGETIECGSVEVVKEEMVEFAERYDPQPFHVDEAAAKESMYGDLIASGWFTCALVARLAFGNGLADVATVGAQGVRDLKWVNPVYAGDTLSATIELTEKQEGDNPTFGHVTMDGTATNQHDAPVLSIGSSRVFIEKRTPPDEA